MSNTPVDLHLLSDDAFVAANPDPQPVVLAIDLKRALPRDFELRVTVGHFRSLRDAGQGHWRLKAVESRTPEGELPDGVELLAGVPVEFREVAAARVQREDGAHYTLAHLRLRQALPGGSRVGLRFQARLSPHAGFPARLMLDIREPGEEAFGCTGQCIALTNRPGPAQQLEARLGPGAVGSGEDARLVVFGTDAVLNHVPDWRGQLVIEATDEAGLPVAGATDQSGRLVITGVKPRQDGQPLRIRVRERDGPLAAETNPLVAALPGGWRVYFGEFHWHSRFSGDGEGEPEAGYTYARDYLNLDFVGLTDHSPDQRAWEQTLALNERFHDPGRFVTLPAWEWSTRRGHANLYLRTPETPAGPGRDYGVDHPAKADWPDDVIVVPHHTNIRSPELRDDGSHYWWEYDWSLPNRRIGLVELVQSRGNFESDRPDARWDVRTGDIGASVQDALAMGYRIGFTGGTDNHAGYPTRDGEQPGRYIGMTGVLAKELTREAIWQAMDQRRTYATSGVPIVCWFALNGALMGQAISAAPGASLRFSARLHGTAPIERVEVVGSGQVIWASEPGVADIALDEEPLPWNGGESGWFYLRLIQSDGHRAWVSPVWVDRSP